MLLCCLFCHEKMIPSYKKEDIPTPYLDLGTIKVYGFICRNCGWYAEFDSDKIIERDGTYGFKGTGD